jgi:hypothetical protein
MVKKTGSKPGIQFPEKKNLRDTESDWDNCTCSPQFVYQKLGYF